MLGLKLYPTPRNALSVGPSVTFFTPSNANAHQSNMRVCALDFLKKKIGDEEDEDKGRETSSSQTSSFQTSSSQTTSFSDIQLFVTTSFSDIQLL